MFFLSTAQTTEVFRVFTLKCFVSDCMCTLRIYFFPVTCARAASDTTRQETQNQIRNSGTASTVATLETRCMQMQWQLCKTLRGQRGGFFSFRTAGSPPERARRIESEADVTRVAGGTNGKLLLARCVPLRSSEKIDRPIGLGSLARSAGSCRRACPPAGQQTCVECGSPRPGPPVRLHPLFLPGGALRIHGYTRRERRKGDGRNRFLVPRAKGF